MFNSFKPGLKEEQRYKMQDSSRFYRTAFPASAYTSRINSVASRLASAEPINRRNIDTKSVKTVKMQATCKDMKADVTKSSSMFGYDIKSKHMATMNNFFASKNFELVANVGATPPPIEKGRDPKAKRTTSAAGEKKPTDVAEGEEPKVIRVPENIELDYDELARQTEASWA